MNNNLKAIREKRGLSQIQFAKQLGIGQTQLSGLELGKTSPTPKGETYLSELASTVSTNLGLLPEKIWPNIYPVHEEFIEPPSNIYNPEDLISGVLLHESVQKILLKLTQREALIICMRFGIQPPEQLLPDGISEDEAYLFDGRQNTLKEISQWFFVTPERIRGIEAKALRKLRHPSRSKHLKYQEHEIDKMFKTVRRYKATKPIDKAKKFVQDKKAKERSEHKEAQRALTEEFRRYQTKIHDYQCKMYFEGLVKQTVARGIALANTMGTEWDKGHVHSILWDGYSDNETTSIIKKNVKKKVNPSAYGKFQYYLMETYADDLWPYVGRPLSILRITPEYVALQPIKTTKVLRLTPDQREFYLLFKGDLADPTEDKYY